jgi:hypothetical protein
VAVSGRGLFIESTEGWDYEWMGMYHLLVDGREYFSDDLEQLERILYARYSGGHAASTTNP